MARKIVINLPDNDVQGSLVKGLNKRLMMLEDMVKDSKKKKKSSEIAGLKKQLKEVSNLQEGLSQKEMGGLKKSMTSISEALSSLGKIRMPSPS